MKGEVPRAYVVLKSDISENKDSCRKQIDDFVNKNVTEYKRLAGGIEFVEAIPKSAAGKILRKDLKARFVVLIVGLYGLINLHSGIAHS